jgi:hypothetical protein
MNLVTASKLAVSTAEAMGSIYKGTVFDELAIVRLANRQASLLWYYGPRRNGFIQSFAADTAALRKDSRERFSQWGQPEIGDFHFVKEGAGTQSEAFVRVGEDAFLILGNTKLSMTEISQNRLWLAAQRPFVEMCDQFRFSPLEVTANTPAEPLGAA